MELIPDAKYISSIEIQNYTDKQFFTFKYQDYRWKVDSHTDTPIQQPKIEKLINILQTASITYLSQTEIPDSLKLPPILSITPLGSKALENSTLVISNMNPTRTAHYAYLSDEPKKIFLIDAVSVEILTQPLSQYYDIILPELNTNAIMHLQIVNTHGDIKISKKINNEFFSNYEFAHPFSGYAVSEQTFFSQFLNLWMGRTPISIVNYYEPSVSQERMEETGLDIPQATLSIQHIDGSSFNLAIGLKADDFHFYAKEPYSDDIWLIPSDLANSILYLHPFDWVMKALMLPNISHTASIELHNYSSERVLDWSSSRATEQESRNLYESIISLQYNQSHTNSSILIEDLHPAYKLRWKFKNKEEKYVIFASYDDNYYYVIIDSILTPFLVEQYQIHQLEKAWIVYSR
nr:DUF4340 domain-containing protein [Entomospira nematocera]